VVAKLHFIHLVVTSDGQATSDSQAVGAIA